MNERNQNVVDSPFHEIDIKNKMLSRLSIYEPYQNKQIGTKVVADLTKEYGLTNLWVNADNERAIHVYEKCGYRKVKPTMYLMKRDKNSELRKRG